MYAIISSGYCLKHNKLTGIAMHEQHKNRYDIKDILKEKLDEFKNSDRFSDFDTTFMPRSFTMKDNVENELLRFEFERISYDW